MKNHSPKKGNPIGSVFMGMTCSVEGFKTEEGIFFQKTYAVLRKFYTVNARYFLSSEVKHALTRGRRYGPFSEHHIFSEMYLPARLFRPDGIDMIRFAINLSALIRAKTNVQAYIPVFSTRPFKEMVADGKKPIIGHMHIGKISLVLTDPTELQSQVSASDLTWIFHNLENFQALLERSPQFRIAFDSFANAEMQTSTAQALLMLWSGIEALLPEVNTEILYRISSYIAAFLEPIGQSRVTLYRTVKKLYGGRCKAAHGSGEHDYKDAVATYSLMKRLLLKCIELKRSPKLADFEQALFVGNT